MLLHGACVALALLASVAANAVDWNAVPATDMKLFLPGQMSWEKTLISGSHKGAKEIRAGDTCTSCHADEEVDIGASQAKLTGFSARSSVAVQFRVAVENGELHWQLSGPALGGKAPDVALLIGGDAIKSTRQASCWAACHDDAQEMASDSGLKLGKYLSRSRVKNTATGGGADIRPQADLDAALAAGEFLDLSEVEANGQGERGYILDKLHKEEVENAASMNVAGDRWSAEFRRPLAASKAGELALEAGKTYYFGIAIHDPGNEGRKHLVSLTKLLAIGSGTAQVVAPPDEE